MKISVDLSLQQVETIVGRLPIAEKIRLVRRLEKETLRQRWNTILKDIDKRLKKFPISGREIAQEIEDYRKEKYAKNCN